MGQDPAEAGWTRENVLWLLHEHGPMTKTQAGAHMGVSGFQIWQWGGIVTPASALFVTTDLAMAYRLLLGATSGIVPDGLDELNLADIDWAGAHHPAQLREGPHRPRKPQPARTSGARLAAVARALGIATPVRT